MNDMITQVFSTNGLLFAPLLPWPFLAGCALLLAALVVFGFVCRMRGIVWRSIPLFILLLAALNPRLTTEEREPLPDIVVLLVDESDSQKVGDRPSQTEAAVNELKERFASQPLLEVREERIVSQPGSGEGTRLFSVLERMMSDIPSQRLAGIVAVTDGQIADVPPPEAMAGLNAPFHTLLTGRRNERDRRLVVESVPAFELIDRKASIVIRVDDSQATMGERTKLSMRRDGGGVEVIEIPLNRLHTVTMPIDHGGTTILDLEAEGADGELSLVNNRAVVSINGIRDRLRVLLISGEPHAGERTWRNLLKADGSVDLVHFTILRPADKNDMTPLNELSLIVFPMRELFEEKLKDFDLIIFDRFQGHWVPDEYFYRLALYVRNGGALLVAGSGSEHETAERLFYGMHTLAEGMGDVLPAVPSGEFIKEGFLPVPTETGRRHPITAGLPGSETFPPQWGRWMHQERAVFQEGEILLNGARDEPLLLVRRVNEGRVAQLMSDTIWLWARGFEEGGPYGELIRRLAHWLMKEPELEEESLTAQIVGNRLVVHARSLGNEARDVIVTTPEGDARSLTLEDRGNGAFAGETVVTSPGVYRIDEGPRNAVVVYGRMNDPEMMDLRATEALLAPVSQASGGGVFWLSDGMPSVRRVSGSGRMADENWFGLYEHKESEVTALHETALLPGFMLLIAGLGGFLIAWRRESRS